MKDTKLSIKISDLLNQVGTTDEVKFENSQISEFPNLTKEGISGTFVVQSLNESSLYGTLENIKCSFDETCDSCQAKFIREVNIPEYSARFALDPKEQDIQNEKSDDEVFLINAKNETINIQDMIMQGILLAEPFVIRCPECEKKFEATNDEEDYGEFESTGNINISFK